MCLDVFGKNHGAKHDLAALKTEARAYITRNATELAFDTARASAIGGKLISHRRCVLQSRAPFHKPCGCHSVGMGAPSRSQGAEFVLAGLAACGAITLTNPIDVVKTRLQLQGELAGKGDRAYTGIGQALFRISQKEGLRGLQRGLVAAYLLQFSNVGCRFGAYGSLKQLLGVKPGASATDSLTSMLLGAASGSLAAVVSNPFFLLKSRFQAAGSEDVLHQHSHPSLRSGKCLTAEVWKQWESPPKASIPGDRPGSGSLALKRHSATIRLRMRMAHAGLPWLLPRPVSLRARI